MNYIRNVYMKSPFAFEYGFYFGMCYGCITALLIFPGSYPSYTQFTVHHVKIGGVFFKNVRFYDWRTRECLKYIMSYSVKGTHPKEYVGKQLTIWNYGWYNKFSIGGNTIGYGLHLPDETDWKHDCHKNALTDDEIRNIDPPKKTDCCEVLEPDTKRYPFLKIFSSKWWGVKDW